MEYRKLAHCPNGIIVLHADLMNILLVCSHIPGISSQET